MKNVALFDGDLIAYRFACASETAIESDEAPGTWTVAADLDEAKQNVRQYMVDTCKRLDTHDFTVAITDNVNFRKAIDPAYKAHRSKQRPPVLLKQLRAWLWDHPKVKRKDGLEADDVLGIIATNPHLYPDSRKIIVSIDKDMESIPGWLFNPMKDENPREICVEQADHKFLTQVLVGDVSDGYKGLPGCGPKKAAVVLAQPDKWKSVVRAFEMSKLTEADALHQARLARILRVEDFNFTTQEPILWTPPSSQ